MSSDPLRRAEIHIFGSSDSPRSIRVTGFADDETVDVPPGQTIVLPANEEVKVPPVIFIPPPVGPTIAAALQLEKRAHLTEDELALVSPGEPIIVSTEAVDIDLQTVAPLAEQAAESQHSLIILAGAHEGA